MKKENYLERLSTQNVYELSKFVVLENFNHHHKNLVPKDIKENTLAVFNEELKYSQDSEIFVSKDNNGLITGSIRVLRWNYIDKLPLHKLFGIDPLATIEGKPIQDIWHIGRFAIKKNIKDLKLFKKLMVCAISPICKHPKNIAFAECDSKLLRIMSLLGLHATVIGPAINYLGSETIPVRFSYDGLIGFYKRNKHLITNHQLLNIDLSYKTTQKCSEQFI